MRLFRVLSIELGEMCGGHELLPLDQVLTRLYDSRGYDSRTQMLELVTTWAMQARPGDVMRTRSSALVCGK